MVNQSLNVRFVHTSWLTLHQLPNGYKARICSCPICGTSMPARDMIPHIECDHQGGEHTADFIKLITSPIPQCDLSCKGQMQWDHRKQVFACTRCGRTYTPAFLHVDSNHSGTATDATPASKTASLKPTLMREDADEDALLAQLHELDAQRDALIASIAEAKQERESRIDSLVKRLSKKEPAPTDALVFEIIVAILQRIRTCVDANQSAKLLEEAESALNIAREGNYV